MIHFPPPGLHAETASGIPHRPPIPPPQLDSDLPPRHRILPAEHVALAAASPSASSPGISPSSDHIQNSGSSAPPRPSLPGKYPPHPDRKTRATPQTASPVAPNRDKLLPKPGIFQIPDLQPQAFEGLIGLHHGIYPPPWPDATQKARQDGRFMEKRPDKCRGYGSSSHVEFRYFYKGSRIL